MIFFLAYLKAIVIKEFKVNYVFKDNVFKSFIKDNSYHVYMIFSKKVVDGRLKMTLINSCIISLIVNRFG